MSQIEAPTQQQAAIPSQFMSPSLYVGDLEPNVSENQLYKIFGLVGQVASIRICRDRNTGCSLGYAYLNYICAQHATVALEFLNFTPVNGKPIRIMISCRDPRGRKSGIANIFVKNLEKSIDSKSLLDTFSMFGSILSCKIATDDFGQSKGYGFVQFEQQESAQSAIDKVNGMLLNNKQVFVGPFARRQNMENSGEASKFSNVFVKNIAETTTDQELRNTFVVYGDISSAVVMRDSERKSKCFGFVNFKNSDDALNGKTVEEKEWYVGRAQKKSEREPQLRAKFEQEHKGRIQLHLGVNLFIKNLDDTIDDEMLWKLFAQFGTIESCKVMRNIEGRSKGSGFVSFSTPEEANCAIASMNGRMVSSRRLCVAPAQRKEDRRAWLQTQTSIGLGQAASTSLPMYQPCSSGIIEPIFYWQPLLDFIPPQSSNLPYQQ